MISHDSHFKIYYKDVDQMGIVYYARYFEIFEMARTELLYSIGASVKNIEKNGTFLPVVSATCNYKKPASFEQSLLVKTQISSLPRARLKIEYKILCEDNMYLIADGETTHGFVDKKGKPRRPPEFLINTLKKCLT